MSVHREKPPRAPTIREVAKLANVSTGTVSRVVNDAADVKPAVRKAVEEAIAELGYVPNAAAKSMRMGRTRTVGCILREINIAQLGGFVSTAQNVLNESGYALLISNSEGRREREIKLLRSFSSGQVDGVLMGPYTPIEGEMEEILRDLPVPLVMIDRDQPSWCDAVYVDHEGGTRLATSHLLGLGHRRIALLTGPMGLHPAVSRVRGFERAHAERGIAPLPDLIVSGSFLRDHAYRATSALLGLSQRPTAIIAGGIDMLSGVLRAIRTHGLGIPGDISVVASGRNDLSDLHQPPIAVVGWEQSEVGATAASLLLDHIVRGSRDEPRRVLIPTTFDPQASCAPPRGQGAAETP
ncbi:LacI family transcriptional regulator [Methylobacterium terricola]|uniref:LacI family transcriptional regulator n=1 Tax=Methylobacterium terricola TaxID=2583531 RepID=A0A5C4L8J4_9HYPH|nr:LacI family DNA-binding transcriptional regulator [Methylobacterium terricola]TNC07979.1 LacI family transcriptional regulator [Methylobacterium terricola]